MHRWRSSTLFLAEPSRLSNKVTCRRRAACKIRLEQHQIMGSMDLERQVAIEQAWAALEPRIPKTKMRHNTIVLSMAVALTSSLRCGSLKVSLR